MKIIAETSTVNHSVPALNSVTANWNIGTDDVKWVDDILTEPYQQIDYQEDNQTWRLIFPAYGGVIFIIDYSRHQDRIQTYAGGAVGNGNRRLDDMDRASIVIYGNETPWEMELRIVHEFLHCEDLPADDLLQYAKKFLSFWGLLMLKWQQFGRRHPENTPCYQRRFYRWLLDRRARGLM